MLISSTALVPRWPAVPYAIISRSITKISVYMLTHVCLFRRHSRKLSTASNYNTSSFTRFKCSQQAAGSPPGARFSTCQSRTCGKSSNFARALACRYWDRSRGGYFAPRLLLRTSIYNHRWTNGYLDARRWVHRLERRLLPYPTAQQRARRKQRAKFSKRRAISHVSNASPGHLDRVPERLSYHRRNRMLPFVSQIGHSESSTAHCD